MAKHGNARHMKRLNAPAFFDIHRKEHKYVTRPRAGRHTLKNAVPIALLLEKLEFAKNVVGAKRMLNTRTVLVNGNPVKDRKYAVGLNDIVEIAAEGKRFRIGMDEQGQVKALPVGEQEANLYKVLGKYKEQGGRLMLRLHDGSAVPGSAEIRVSDSVTVEKGKVAERLKLGEGAQCTVIGGMHAGTEGAVKGLLKGSVSREGSVIIERKDGSRFETLVRNIIVTK